MPQRPQQKMNPPEADCFLFSDKMKVKELINLVQKDGWIQTRMKGSHRQFKHSLKPGTVTISGKLNVDVPPGTLNSILKQADLK